VSTPEQYVAELGPEHRAAFDRVDALLRTGRDGVEVSISYGILKYAFEGRRVYLGVWKHGISLYGWSADADGGFAGRHPDLLSGRGTLKIRLARAAEIPDAEFLTLFDAVLGTHSKRDGSPAPTRTTSG
jgi:hypothetical protein